MFYQDKKITANMKYNKQINQKKLLTNRFLRNVVKIVLDISSTNKNFYAFNSTELFGLY